MMCWAFAAAALVSVVSWLLPAASAVFSHTLLRETLRWIEREREHLDNIIEIPAAGILLLLIILQ